MKRFNKILKDIKDIKIQGANNIAKAGIKAFLLQPTKQSAKQILATRPTEPLMQNAIKFLLKSKNPKSSANKFLSYIKMSNTKIAKIGARLIKNNMNVFTHCHSSTAVSILKYAKQKQKKKFVVYNTETDPLLQGRKTAIELVKTGIKVIHVPDTASEYSLKKADLFIFGADAFLKKGCVNKIGTAMYAELAHIHKIPNYTAGISLKFTKKAKMEMRSGKEVWDENYKNILTINPAFDFVPKKLLKATISEFGILPYNQFIKKAKKNLKSWR